MGAAGFSSQLFTLLKRNMVLKRRMKMQTSLELFFPLFMCMILQLNTRWMKLETKPAIPYFPIRTIDYPIRVDLLKPILVVTNSSEALTLMRDVATSLNINAVPSVIHYQTNYDADKAYRDGVSSTGVAINVTDSSWQYQIRLPFKSVAKTDSKWSPETSCRKPGVFDYSCPADTYISSGFLQIKKAIDTAILRKELQRPYQFDVKTQMMPKHETKTSLGSSMSKRINTAIYVVVGYSFFLLVLTTNLVVEKERKIRESMRIMGMRDGPFWAAWIIIYLILIGLISVVWLIICLIFKFLIRSSYFIFFLLIYAYGVSMVMFGFLMSTFFRKATTAGSVAQLLSIMCSAVYIPLTVLALDDPIPSTVKWLLSILSPVSVSLGVDRLVEMDSTQWKYPDGCVFSTINDGDYSVLSSLIMEIVDAMLYAFLAFYLENALPGEYGKRQSPFFLCMPSYWGLSSAKTSLLQTSSESPAPPVPDQTNVEAPPPEFIGNETIRLFDIKKSFKKVHAVRGISLDIYENQITALLGHNAAGKTTLVNMLTGMSPPSSGTATIYGRDIDVRSDIDSLRNIVGVCPQEDILFDFLTCEEHLEFAAGIKGVPRHDIASTVKTSLEDVALTEQTKKIAKQLSGGQKRKLSLAMALIGSPKVLFLDEPTSALDPYSRRQVWTLLKSIREGRTIVLTTHFMDEADILADRKAVISKGKLKCCGSSFFLKTKFGAGYHLSVVLVDYLKSDVVTAVVQRHIPSATLSALKGTDLGYTLPIGSEESFPSLFRELDEYREVGSKKLVSSYGISMTTLEEVFLKLEEEAETDEKDDDEVCSPDGVALNENNRSKVVGGLLLDDDKGEVKPLTVAMSLCKIRVLILLRNFGSIVGRLILPTCFIAAGLILFKFITPQTQHYDPPMLSFATDFALSMKVALFQTSDSLFYFSHWLGSEVKKVTLVNTTSTPIFSIEPQDAAFLNSSYQNHTAFTTILYNDSTVHTLPAALGLFTRGLISNFTDNTTTIDGGSLPWPARSQELVFNWTAFLAFYLMALALSLLPNGFAVDVVKDRQFKTRSQLRISGVSWGMYWATCFLVDLAQFLIPITITVILVIALRIESFAYGGATFVTILLYLLYMPLIILVAYLISFLFSNFETCQSIMPLIMFIIVLLPYLVVSLTSGLASQSTGDALHYVFVWINPCYGAVGGLFQISSLYMAESIKQLTTKPIIEFGDYFKWNNKILVCLLAPFVHVIWLFFLLRVLDIRSTGGDIRDAFFLKPKPPTSSLQGAVNFNGDHEEEDSDVHAEKERVNNWQNSHPSLMTIDLRKRFPVDSNNCLQCQKPADLKYKLAVDGLTLAVESGEIFGLLGPNGAGKSTSLNLVIAETSPTDGRVMVGGLDVSSSLSDAMSLIGYCPQYNALWDSLKMREHIELYGRINGISADRIGFITDFAAENLRITEHLDKPAKKLSGGTKRKLCFIISILCSKQLVLLDEPSTGMDPASKRFLWDVIEATIRDNSADDSRRKQKAAVLTTHYMEEADALCSRIGIMVNGVLACLGSSQHLKDKFGSGYILEVILKPNVNEDDRQAVDGFIKVLFPRAAIYELFSNRVTYRVPQDDVFSLATVFERLEHGKAEVAIEDYSFSQSSLEQVFLEFAKMQTEDEQGRQTVRSRTSLRRVSPSPPDHV